MNGRTLLDAVLEPGGLSLKLQPIFEVDGQRSRVHALECLCRGPQGTNLADAEVLLRYVQRKRAEAAFDRACVRLAVETSPSLFASLGAEINLCLNVHAATLSRDEGFPSFLAGAAEAAGIPPARLTMEIVEHPCWDQGSFLRAVENLRRLGVRLAVDDVGRGDSHFRRILECQPDYIKIDRYLVRGCSTDTYRRAVLESIAFLARRFGAWVVAEGVENREDLDVLLDLGIHLIQGYLLADPLSPGELAARDLFAGGLPVPVPVAQGSSL